jgi:hypothetical protein
VIDVVGGADIVDMGEVNSGQELRGLELTRRDTEWRLALMREMEAARQGLERMMEAQGG